MKKLLLLLTIAVLVIASTARAQQPPAGGAPKKAEPKPVLTPAQLQEATIRDYIKQLGDPDFNRREAATYELKTIGKPAIPLLTAAKDSPDAEVHSRVEAIITAINAQPEPPPAPKPPVPDAAAAGAGGAVVGTRTTIIKTFETDNWKYQVVQVNDSIPNGVHSLTVTIIGTMEGKELKSTIEAVDEKDLEQKNPEVFKIIKANEAMAKVRRINQQIRAKP